MVEAALLGHGAESLQEGNGDVGRDAGAASGDFTFGGGSEKAREEDGDVASGVELVEIANEFGGSIGFRRVSRTKRRIGSGEDGSELRSSGGKVGSVPAEDFHRAFARFPSSYSIEGLSHRRLKEPPA